MLGLVVWLSQLPAWAGFTETLPQGAFLLDETMAISWIDSNWDNDGDAVPLIEAVERYEPGGGRQGVITARPKARYLILVNQLQYGLLDDLAIGFGVPVVLSTRVEPNLGWEPGDYQNQLGRAYSEEDFWAWADSMGQPRPTTWVGNQGVLSDIVIGSRFRFSDRLAGFDPLGLAAAVSLAAVVPTGRNADPEEIMSLGTSLWDLHTQGDLAIHLSVDKDFNRELDGRLRLGIDLFYELFFERELRSAEGSVHPLLLQHSPYVGETYQVKPGDFSGFAVQISAVPYRGPAWESWLTDGGRQSAEGLPPILSVELRYTFVHLQQTDWRSDHPTWDWEREKLWRPGYKNILELGLSVSLLRIGVPVFVYANFRTLNLIPGKNCRAAEVLSFGLRVPLKLW